jgi:HSP20 family molecular chaperone IbpA
VELPLPAQVDPEHVEANYERGLLRITLPKRPVAG